jgi:hypothetical protein
MTGGETCGRQRSNRGVLLDSTVAHRLGPKVSNYTALDAAYGLWLGDRDTPKKQFLITLRTKT